MPDASIDSSAAPSSDPLSSAAPSGAVEGNTGTPIEDELEFARVSGSDLVFEGKVWNVRRDRFGYNDASIVREYVDHTGAVAILALDDQDRVLLIKQYRHPVRARDWEIPAGLLDIEGEDALTAAKRELAEEADVRAAEWSVLTDFYTSPGGSSEAIRIYLARGLTDLDAFDRTDEEADIELRWVPLDECVDAALARRIQNPSLVLGVLAAQASKARDWSTLAPADAPWPRHPSNWGVAGSVPAGS